MLFKVAGIDVGKKRDPSALVMLEGEIRGPRRRIIGADRLPLKKTYPDQAEDMAKFAAGADLIMMDGSGVGAAVVDIIRLITDIPVWSVVTTGGEKAKIVWEEKAINVPKKAIVEHLGTSLEKGMLTHRIPDIQGQRILDVLLQEMEKFERRGQKMEAALGKHDDVVMALCIGLLGYFVGQKQEAA